MPKIMSVPNSPLLIEINKMIDFDKETEVKRVTASDTIIEVLVYRGEPMKKYVITIVEIK